MENKLTILATFSLIALATSQPAFAGGESGARFHFSPNYWNNDSPGHPVSRAVEMPHSVKSGSVPQGTSFLGVDPQLLAKPAPVAPPVTQTVVTAQPRINQTSGQVLSKTPFNNSFGKPADAAPPVVASAPSPLPMVAPAKAFAPQMSPVKPIIANKPAHSHSDLNSSRHVHAVLASHPHRSAVKDGLAAKPGDGLDSYGKNVGYVPGAYLPASTGDGTRTEANVSGRLIH